jgi:hypothetical protein
VYGTSIQLPLLVGIGFVAVHPMTERPKTTDSLDVKAIVESLRKKGYDVGQPLGTGVSAVVYAGVRTADGLKWVA